MTETIQTAAIITARGGSKRIPRKNVRSFRGRPMLAWSIEAALNSGVFDTVMVSTDDADIAQLAVSLGAEVPFMRSEGNSNDYATTADVIKEVLADFSKTHHQFDYCCCIYPTAPFIQPADLIEGYQLIQRSQFDVVMPVAEFSYPIWRSLARDEQGCITLNYPENLNVRSQDLPSAYHDAGQWYWFRTDAFQRTGTLLGSNTGSLLLSSLQVQDIDTEEDWALAEVKHAKLFAS